jgi:isocitrate lyase
VPTSAHISRLVASRLQLDLLQHTMLLIARTDAESARLLSSTVDARDHPYIRGVPSRLPDGSRRLALAEVLDRAEAEGRSGAEIDDLEAKWLSEVKLTTFDEGKVMSSRFGEVSCPPRARADVGFGVTVTSGRASDSGVEQRSVLPKDVCSRALSGGGCWKVKH